MVTSSNLASSVANFLVPSLVELLEDARLTVGLISLSSIVIWISELTLILPLITESIESDRLSSSSLNILSSVANKNTVLDVSPAGSKIVFFCGERLEPSLFEELFNPASSHLQPPLGSE